MSYLNLKDDDRTLPELLAIIGFSIAGMFIQAYSVPLLWLWFLVPLGLPAINWAHAFGIALVVHCFAPKRHFENDPKPSLGWSFGMSVAAPLLTLGLGAVWHYFM